MKRQQSEPSPRDRQDKVPPKGDAPLVEGADGWPLTGDVATRLGVSESSVVRLANEGYLKHLRDGSGRRRYDPTSVAAAAVMVANRNAATKTAGVAVALAEGEIAAAVFQHLQQGTDPVSIVMMLKLPPEVVTRCCQQYDQLQSDRRAFARRISSRGQFRIARVLGVPAERLSTDAEILVAIEARVAKEQTRRAADSALFLEVEGGRVLVWVPTAPPEDGSATESRPVDVTNLLGLGEQERQWIGLESVTDHPTGG